MLEYCFCLFYVWFPGSKACGILVPPSEIEPSTPELEGEILTTEPPEKFPTESLTKGHFHWFFSSHYYYLCIMTIILLHVGLFERIHLGCLIIRSPTGLERSPREAATTQTLIAALGPLLPPGGLCLSPTCLSEAPPVLGPSPRSPPHPCPFSSIWPPKPCSLSGYWLGRAPRGDHVWPEGQAHFSTSHHLRRTQENIMLRSGEIEAQREVVPRLRSPIFSVGQGRTGAQHSWPPCWAPSRTPPSLSPTGMG